MKLIIWDNDGVIVDSLIPSIELIRESVKKFTEKEMTNMEVFEHLGAKETEEVTKLAGEEAGKYFETKKEKILEEIKVFSGIPELLEKAEKVGIKQCLVTGRDKKGALVLLNKKAGNKKVIDYMSQVIAGDDYEGKEIAFKKVSQGYKKTEVLVIGDEPKDIIVGKKLGFKTIGALWSKIFEKEVKATNPDETHYKPETISFL